MNFGEASAKRPISVGPWGGQQGLAWDDGFYSTVRQLVITHGAGIDCIQIEYDERGTSIWSGRHGGNGGDRTNKIKLDYPDEFLTSIHGHYGGLNDWGPVFIRSLTLESNKKTYGPFGIETGTYFSFAMTGGKIVGFHGKSNWYLDAIGAYLRPIENQYTSKALAYSQKPLTNGTEKVGYSVIQTTEDESIGVYPIAVRPKDEFGNPLKKQVSDLEKSGVGTMEKLHSFQMPGFEKLVPSKVDSNGVVTYGPWGGTGGTMFDDRMYTGIKRINLSRNMVGIVWIRVLYDRDGDAIWGSKHGGNGGYRNEKLVFDYPSEILTHIVGFYGPVMYMGPNVIKSLTFYTNKRKYGPYGEEQGASFTTKLKEGKIVGIHGREGLFIDALGVHVIEGKVMPSNPSPSNAITSSNEPPIAEIAGGVIKEPAPCGPGPWGGDGGRPWDDGVFSGIKQIYLTRSSEAICSIQIEYDRNGQSIWSIKHGGNGGTSTHRLQLEYPHEVLTCVSGYYGCIGRDERPKVVRSLTLYTSRGRYGPYGEEVGTYFTSTTTEGKVVGFHGRSSSYLDAIGVHMQHWLGSQKPTGKSSLFKLIDSLF
ncbi:jacalin-related lectin 3 isoform X1 [Juglans regia]|uniref:Jacalin-related lectin 3 isoform X1 n=1 Tax=Juglans regia TaxID=51240 RepID=A0A2I4ENU7_JUGRE|nr:jacalin-related lectin 3 isoform X1 [Juglans regia]